LSIIDSTVFGIGTLPEAKIGLVKRMPKRGMDSYRLHALTFRNPDLLFRQPIQPGLHKPVGQRVPVASIRKWPRPIAGSRTLMERMKSAKCPDLAHRPLFLLLLDNRLDVFFTIDFTM